MNFRITILSDRSTWLNKRISELRDQWLIDRHEVTWVNEADRIPQGDMCFLIGCSDLLAPEVLKRNTNNLVVHESNLPEGRGWSPLTWQVLAGRNVITVSLLEVQEKVDSGPIYMQTLIELQGHELVGELRNKQAAATLKLCHDFVSNFPLVLSNAKEQSGEASYFPRRHPNDSELDPDKTISEQFNLLRVVDNDQYPAFFVMNGCKYILKIEKEQSDKS